MAFILRSLRNRDNAQNDVPQNDVPQHDVPQGDVPQGDVPQDSLISRVRDTFSRNSKWIAIGAAVTVVVIIVLSVSISVPLANEAKPQTGKRVGVAGEELSKEPVWSNWSECSKTCKASGFRTRHLECDEMIKPCNITTERQECGASCIPGCDKGWFIFGHYCYYFTTDAVRTDWNGSVEACRLLGARLIDIRNERERLSVKSHLKAKSRYAEYHIGMTDDVAEGSWKYVDGTAVTFLAWAPGEPNGGRASNCGNIFSWYEKGRYNDSPCTHGKGNFICKKNPTIQSADSKES